MNEEECVINENNFFGLIYQVLEKLRRGKDDEILKNAEIKEVVWSSNELMRLNGEPDVTLHEREGEGGGVQYRALTLWILG